MSKYHVLLLFICWICIVSAISVIPKEMENFMKKYGYLNSDDGLNTNAMKTDVVYTQENAKDSLRQMQKFGGLPETGILDDKTLALLTLPRCGYPDVLNKTGKSFNRIKRYTIGFGKWEKKTITYSIIKWPQNLGEKLTKKIIAKAFGLWTNVISLKIIYETNPNADIIISFESGDHGDHVPFDGPGNNIAHGFNPINSSLLKGDIHFDADEKWIDVSQKEINENEYYLFTSALHEIGHSLGLAHSHVKESVMSPYYQHVPGLTLHDDDIRGIKAIYKS